jgi:transposase-like protein
MNDPIKLLVTPELEKSFRSFVTASRAVELTLQTVIDMAMNIAAKKHEALNTTLEQWWDTASQQYGLNFSEASYHVKNENGRLYIMLVSSDGEPKPRTYPQLDS